MRQALARLESIGDWISFKSFTIIFYMLPQLAWTFEAPQSPFRLQLKVSRSISNDFRRHAGIEFFFGVSFVFFFCIEHLYYGSAHQLTEQGSIQRRSAETYSGSVRAVLTENDFD